MLTCNHCACSNVGAIWSCTIATRCCTCNMNESQASLGRVFGGNRKCQLAGLTFTHTHRRRHRQRMRGKDSYARLATGLATRLSGCRAPVLAAWHRHSRCGKFASKSERFVALATFIAAKRNSKSNGKSSSSSKRNGECRMPATVEDNVIETGRIAARRGAAC